MKVIITGATGMVGKGVLFECLDHESITEVLTIGRSPVGITHAKLKELIHEDFSDFSTATEPLRGYDACYCCMGVSVTGLNEETYTKLTYEYTLALARELVELNPNMIITYVSGEGTDSSEEGRRMWARVKGKTENALVLLGFKAAYMFRPGLIIPLRGIKSRTRIYQFAYDYFMWLVKLMKWITPNSVVNTTQLGLAMINVTLKGYNSQILRPKDIILISQNL